ncbi:low molecular weight phosphatase family protein [Nitrospira lenta]|uniref:protein-tyrosine-phosphatase n=1 Tax=Nitrospira lenta TaxID=1436998 RepID=A0A330L2B4_9BACT|nr:low molecular weight phosphatase family protein [Nitrospira lenta]SPP63880.1 putative Low molecular weight protein-tyrosine-phosphatase [Nitrospira lenta]
MAQPSVRSILFVCTGNIFRSLAAEYALKQYREPSGLYRVGSAGIEAKPQSIHPIVRARLVERGADPAGHLQRKLTQALLDEADCVVAMGRDHQEAVQRLFGRSIPLFNQLCCARDEPILDLHEAIPTWEQDVELAQAYVVSVVDHICDAIPHFAARLSYLL